MAYMQIQEVSFTDYLIKKGEVYWEKYLHHPFVKGIGDGTLDVEAFRYYMCQDYVYLIDYAKLYAYGIIKARDVKTMELFSAVAQGLLHTEMELHRQYAAKFGITLEELENTKPSPTTLTYTKYLLSVAQTGSLAELVACLLPCILGYAHIGKRLYAAGLPEGQPLYHDWIRMYASEEMDEMAEWMADLLNRLACEISEEERKRLEEHFITATKLEYLFWEMSYKKEEWPL
jgi:thiaminase/transcriptional activator TenA